jgi:hypothetical protein
MPHSMLLSLKNKILKYPTYSPYLSLFEKKKHTKKTRILIVITYLCVVLQINLLFFFKKKKRIFWQKQAVRISHVKKIKVQF